jgi:acetyl esterase/lipase
LALVRLIFAALCAGLSLLTVVEAPTSLLWLAALGATEWGYWLAPLALLTWLPGWRQSQAGQVGAWLGLAAALLLMTPLLRAGMLVRTWPDELPPLIRDARPPAGADAFPRSSPLAPADLLLGVPSAEVARREVVYAVNGGQPLALDVYRIAGRAAGEPAGATRAPGIIVVHGGSWQHGDRAELAALNSYLAARGYIVASVSYRFAPQWPFPAARDDVRAAIAFLKAHAGEYGLDPRRLVLLGRSAGGQIALSLAYAASDPDIRGVVAFYAPTDMVYSYEHPSNPLVLDSIAVLEAYLGGNPLQAPAVYEAASPIGFVTPDTVPTLLIHGGRDELVFPTQSERLAARLAQAHRPHYFLRLPWATHGCDAHFSGPCGQISTYVVERFLASVIRD